MQETTSQSNVWRLRLRNDLHLARKVWHCGMGLFMVFIYLIGTPKLVCVLLLLSALAFTLTLEYGRLRFPRLNEWAIKAMGPLMRKSEVSKVSGTPFYVGSVLLSVIIFPKSIAILSILFLAIGDPISSVFGILYGDLGPRFSNGKSLIGTAAGMGICCLITFVYFVMNQNSIGASALIALAGGIAGGGAEMIPLDIDDNFSIPLVSGLALWVTYLFVGV
jgi:diacylglycerol kinase (CTP)